MGRHEHLEEGQYRHAADRQPAPDNHHSAGAEALPQEPTRHAHRHKREGAGGIVGADVGCPEAQPQKIEAAEQ